MSDPNLTWKESRVGVSSMAAPAAAAGGGGAAPASASSADAAALPPLPPVLAHYMPWFALSPAARAAGQHWSGPGGQLARKSFEEVAGGAIASHERPLWGAYDSRSPDAIQRHLCLLRLAGVVGVVINFYGVRRARGGALVFADEDIAPIVREVVAAGMLFTVCYEDWTVIEGAKWGVRPEGADLERARAQLARDFEYVRDELMVQPGFLREGSGGTTGRPIVLVFGPRVLCERADWEATASEVFGHRPPKDQPRVFTLHGAWGEGNRFAWFPPAQEGSAPVPLAACQAYLQGFYTAERTRDLAAIGVAWPGYRDFYREGGNESAAQPAKMNRLVLPSHDGRTLETSLASAREHQPLFLQLATWNDWQEGTQFEPSVEHNCSHLEGVARQVGSGGGAASPPWRPAEQWGEQVGEESRGRTRGAQWHPLPPSPVLLLAASAEEEFRVLLAPRDAGETRDSGHGASGVLCIVIRQDGGTQCALGFGNPHRRQASEYRACALPAGAGCCFYVAVDAASGWVVLGAGHRPSEGSVLLQLRLAPGDARLAGLQAAAVSGWRAPLGVTARLLPVGAPAVLQRLVVNRYAREKFDLLGRCTLLRGLTCVCPLAPAGQLHGVMRSIAAAIAAQSLLAGVYALLPPESYHMTVLSVVDGVGFAGRAAAAAAAGSGLTAPLQLLRGSEHTSGLEPGARAYVHGAAARLASAGVSASAEWTLFPMRVTRATATRLHLAPWDDAVERALAAWRRSVGKLLGAGADGAYQFHATIAYDLMPAGACEGVRAAQRAVQDAAAAALTEEVARAPHLFGMPALCFFESMAAFHPIEAAQATQR